MSVPPVAVPARPHVAASSLLEHARRAAERLASAGIGEARLDAELLLAHVLGRPRLELFLERETTIGDDARARYDALIERRARREPLQYIIGRTSFREIELRTDARALIPRPETEVLAGVALEWARAHGAPKLHALDVGTGTGALALSLLAENGVTTAVATDVSADALQLAAENAAALGLAARVELRAGETWAPIRAEERFDVIVSNPPYIASTEAGALQPEVVEWEPHGALFAAGGGLAVLEPLVQGASAHLARPGLFAVELAPWQTEAMADLARASGLVRVRIIEDLTGRPRIVAGETV